MILKTYIAPLLISIVVSIIWIFLFKKLWIMDKPGNDLKNTRKPVPTIQWIFVYIAFLLIIRIIYPDFFHQAIFQWLLRWSLPIVIVQTIDELRYIDKIKFNLPPLARLFSHVLWWILAVYIWNLGNQEILIQWVNYMIPQWIFIIFFIWRSILCINAVNRFDGIYAQASWVSSVWFLTIFLLINFVVFKEYPYLTQENYVMLTWISKLAFVLFSISLVSAFVEYKPLALVRDVGIMFYGFALAYLSVIWWAKIWTLIVALSLVIFDALRVWFYRIFIMKKSPLKWDYTHLHHRLMWLGWNRKEVRAFVWIRSVLMMVLILLQWADRMNKVIIFGMMATVFFGLNIYLFLIKKLPCGLNLQKNN